MAKKLCKIERGLGFSIGPFAGEATNSIVLNATETQINPVSSRTYLDPVRQDDTNSNVLAYNTETKEITFKEISASNLQQVTDLGNSTTNSIGVQNTNPQHALSVGDPVTLFVDTVNNKLSFGAQGINIEQLDQTKPINIGYNDPGSTIQGNDAIALGNFAGDFNQGERAVSIGYFNANSSQGVEAISIGSLSAELSQNNFCISIGSECGVAFQGEGGIAIGRKACETGQFPNAIAIGRFAGDLQGQNSIAIGAYSNSVDNSIVLNATGSTFFSTETNSFYVNPIRILETPGSNILSYNSSTGEITTSSKALNINTMTTSATIDASNAYYDSAIYIPNDNVILTFPPAVTGMKITTLVAGSFNNIEVTTNTVGGKIWAAGASSNIHDIKTNGGHGDKHEFICVDGSTDTWVTDT